MTDPWVNKSDRICPKTNNITKKVPFRFTNQYVAYLGALWIRPSNQSSAASNNSENRLFCITYYLKFIFCKVIRSHYWGYLPQLLDYCIVILQCEKRKRKNQFPLLLLWVQSNIWSKEKKLSELKCTWLASELEHFIWGWREGGRRLWNSGKWEQQSGGPFKQFYYCYLHIITLTRNKQTAINE